MRINGLHHDIPSLSVSQLLHEVSLPTKGVAVAVNGEIVRRSEWETFVVQSCLLYTSPSPRDRTRSRMPSSA